MPQTDVTICTEAQIALKGALTICASYWKKYKFSKPHTYEALPCQIHGSL